MAGRLVGVLSIVALVLGVSGTHALADVASESASNVQEGDNEAGVDQDGEASSGDAVAGQVVGVVSSGDTSIDATNSSVGAEAASGEASGANAAAAFVGLAGGAGGGAGGGGGTVGASDVLVGTAVNVQEGDNEAAFAQSVSAVSGDAVAGQVIGAVTSAGGTTDIVAANTSDDAAASTGSVAAANLAAAFVGLLASVDNDAPTVTASDVIVGTATNVQEGDNAFAADQTADAPSGDAVAGQVIGTVSAGDTSIDATNDSTGAGADSGGSEALNLAAAFVGLVGGAGDGDGGTVTASDVLAIDATNVQEGDNEAGVAQSASAPTGDAVAGQVVGVVTSAGGSADLVLANTTDGYAATGSSAFANEAALFVGQAAEGILGVF